MLAGKLRDGVLKLRVANRRLYSGDGTIRGPLASQERIAGDVESREGGRADARQSDLARKVLRHTSPSLHVLALHETNLEAVQQGGIERVKVSTQHALNTYVGLDGERIGVRNAVGARVIRVRIVDVVARRNTIFFADGVVQLPHYNVPVQNIAAVGKEVVRTVGAAIPVRNRPESAGSPRHRVDPAGGNSVIRERLLHAVRQAEWIVYTAGNVREISAALRKPRHSGDNGIARSLAGLLPTGEEMRLILADGAAERAAELIQAQWRLGLREEIPRVQRIIPKILEQTAVILIGARPRSERYNSAGGMAILGRITIGDDAELFQRVQRKTGNLRRSRQTYGIADGAAVQRKHLVACSSACHGKNWIILRTLTRIQHHDAR